MPVKNGYSKRLSSGMRLNSIVALLALIGLTLVTVICNAFDFATLAKAVARATTPRAADTIKAWANLLVSARDVPDGEKLKQVNDFFNRNTQFEEDQRLWAVPDYWATPLETMNTGAGDCEDFSIAKYFTLKAVGIPVERLRLVYVKAQIGGPSSGMNQAHMVLAYYTSPDSEPLVLDNLISEIRPASRRTDLSPVFSFNSDGIWAGSGNKDPNADSSRLSRWRDLLARARAEGFD